jgi:hypothetical protein
MKKTRAGKKETNPAALKKGKSSTEVMRCWRCGEPLDCCEHSKNVSGSGMFLDLPVQAVWSRVFELLAKEKGSNLRGVNRAFYSFFWHFATSKTIVLKQSSRVPTPYDQLQVARRKNATRLDIKFKPFESDYEDIDFMLTSFGGHAHAATQLAESKDRGPWLKALFPAGGLRKLLPNVVVINFDGQVGDYDRTIAVPLEMTALAPLNDHTSISLHRVPLPSLKLDPGVEKVQVPVTGGEGFKSTACLRGSNVKSLTLYLAYGGECCIANESLGPDFLKTLPSSLETLHVTGSGTCMPNKGSVKFPSTLKHLTVEDGVTFFPNVLASLPPTLETLKIRGMMRYENEIDSAPGTFDWKKLETLRNLKKIVIGYGVEIPGTLNLPGVEIINNN